MADDMDTASPPPLARRALAEFLGTGLLVTIVVGSGIAARTLSPGDTGLQLLQSSLATALGLAVLILALGPVSGAHLNPLVSAVDALLGRRDRAGLSPRELAMFVGAQLLGGLSGAVLANAMFEIPTSIATTERVTAGTLLGEVVATAGLILVILSLARTGRGPLAAAAVGAYIGAAYWFTSSTSFANPAVTLGRVLTDTFAGIAPASVLPFVAAQIVGAAIGVGLAVLLFPGAARAAGRLTTPATSTSSHVRTVDPEGLL